MTIQLKIQKWHLYIVDLEPRVGTKPGKQRPCICIQPTELNELLSSAVVIPLTTKVSKQEAFPIRVRIQKGILGLEQESEALIDQMLAWDVRLFRKDLGEIPEALQMEVKAALIDFLDLD